MILGHLSGAHHLTYIQPFLPHSSLPAPFLVLKNLQGGSFIVSVPLNPAENGNQAPFPPPPLPPTNTPPIMSNWPIFSGSFNITQDSHWYHVSITSTGDGLPLTQIMVILVVIKRLCVPTICEFPNLIYGRPRQRRVEIRRTWATGIPGGRTAFLAHAKFSGGLNLIARLLPSPLPRKYNASDSKGAVLTSIPRLQMPLLTTTTPCPNEPSTFENGGNILACEHTGPQNIVGKLASSVRACNLPVMFNHLGVAELVQAVVIVRIAAGQGSWVIMTAHCLRETKCLVVSADDSGADPTLPAPSDPPMHVTIARRLQPSMQTRGTRQEYLARFTCCGTSEDPKLMSDGGEPLPDALLVVLSAHDKTHSHVRLDSGSSGSICSAKKGIKQQEHPVRPCAILQDRLWQLQVHLPRENKVQNGRNILGDHGSAQGKAIPRLWQPQVHLPRENKVQNGRNILRDRECALTINAMSNAILQDKLATASLSNRRGGLESGRECQVAEREIDRWRAFMLCSQGKDTKPFPRFLIQDRRHMFIVQRIPRLQETVASPPDHGTLKTRLASNDLKTTGLSCSTPILLSIPPHPQHATACSSSSVFPGYKRQSASGSVLVHPGMKEVYDKEIGTIDGAMKDPICTTKVELNISWVRTWHLIHGIPWQVNKHETDALLKSAEKSAPPPSKKEKREPFMRPPLYGAGNGCQTRTEAIQSVPYHGTRMQAPLHP
ncbi:hypothetical protein FA15DRAFT_729890 [Coprinopsis marcescibilis]|uniref:Uncharacterized protein n=1 Tax=Coprinopsis marcescibilis TaxID=230819 RepID=A0A5C3KFD4_COPMA|nr:hypothetical protein FA15DRAFT_729890 [Coprinopsis marcescibilis]